MCMLIRMGLLGRSRMGERGVKSGYCGGGLRGCY